MILHRGWPAAMSAVVLAEHVLDVIGVEFRWLNIWESLG
jgi:hypothetical protein